MISQPRRNFNCVFSELQKIRSSTRFRTDLCSLFPPITSFPSPHTFSYVRDILITENRMVKAPMHSSAFGSKPVTLQIGVALRRTGRLGEAIEHWQKAQEIDPDYAEADHDLGFALALSGRKPEAMEWFRLSFQLKPDCTQAQDPLARLHASRYTGSWALSVRLRRVLDRQTHFERVSPGSDVNSISPP